MKLPSHLNTSLPADVAEINTLPGKNFQVYVRLIQISHTILKYISKKLTFSFSKTILPRCLLSSNHQHNLPLLTLWFISSLFGSLGISGGHGSSLIHRHLLGSWPGADGSTSNLASLSTWEADDTQLKCSLHGFSLQLLRFLHSWVRYKKKKIELSSPLKAWV